jgi:hypothetical protein
MTREAEQSAGEQMLSQLLADSHQMRPDAIPEAAATAGALIGLSDVRLYVADVDQRMLVPFGHGGDSTPLTIDGTVAGRCYRRSEVVQTERSAGSTQVWFPLLDGSSRVGVMGASLSDDADRLTIERGGCLATLVAELAVAKSLYGDNLLRAARINQLSIAAEMRWSLLPPLSFECPQVAVCGILEPAYEIAGDAFDYAVNGDTLHVAIFDAMGHGLTASRLANLAVFGYRNSRRAGDDLEEMYRFMDKLVMEEFGEDSFVTAQVLTLDLPSGVLRWINAGHPRPLLLRDGGHAGELDAAVSFPLGIGAREAEVGEAALQPGDTLLLFSDGVVEARSPEGEEFGQDRLVDMWVKVSLARETPAETVRRLAHAVFDHQGGHLQDDATLLLVHWPGRR